MSTAALKLPKGVFLGWTLRQLRIDDLTLTESGYAPGTRLPRHTHHGAFFSVVLTGGYVERLDGKERRRTPYSVAFHPRGEEHADDFDGIASRTLGVELSDRWTDRLGEVRFPTGAPALWLAGPSRGIAMRLAAEIRLGEDGSPLLIEGLVLEMAGEASRARDRFEPRRPPRWLCGVEERLRSEFRSPPALADLAAVAGVHPVHLARAFRRFYRCPCGEFVRRLRVEHAERRLTDSLAPIAEIALESGFYDQSHFTRQFRRATGLSPAAYRARLRGS